MNRSVDAGITEANTQVQDPDLEAFNNPIAETSGTSEGSPSRNMFNALKGRNYRTFLFGAFLSNIGSWMQVVAQGWLVLQLTDSAFWLGLDGFMATLPGFALTLLSGVLADLVDRRRMLIWTQVCAGLSALTLAMLVVTDSLHVWMVLALSFVTGSCIALSAPSSHAFTVDIVERQYFSNAVALNASQFNLARVIGPVLAGLALKTLGTAGCFFINAFSYIAIISALMRIDSPISKNTGRSIRTSSTHKEIIWQDLKEGFHYVLNRPRIRTMLLISIVLSIFGMPYLSLLPIFARDILRLDEGGLALLTGAMGAGALAGALFMAIISGFRRKILLVFGGGFCFGLFTLGFSLSARYQIAVLFLFGMGAMIGIVLTSINTLIQYLVENRMRGRVSGIYVFASIGTMPIGNLLGGISAERFGAPVTLATGSIIIMIIIIYIFLTNKRLREMK